MSGPDGWKNTHANESYEAVKHPLVQRVIAEFAENMNFPLEGLPRYGLEKIAMYAAQVARAQCLGFDPDLLRLTPDEYNALAMERAAELVYGGVPTFVIPDTPHAGASTEGSREP